MHRLAGAWLTSDPDPVLWSDAVAIVRRSGFPALRRCRPPTAAPGLRWARATATATAMTTRSPVVPFAVAAGGIAVYSGMDANMKGLSIAGGAYIAVLWRSVAGVAPTGVVFVARRRRWPTSSPLCATRSANGPD